ncbi:hypothetical protein M405DRAFT_847471 [Rhizopogon salebrosus TDB-379]|nr:hypothetical protein M405DRAFT_847471 [Rhizopogon salebrosus TDB-379]
MAPTTRGRTSDSIPTLQARAKQAKSVAKKAVANRKRLLEKEEKAEAARQELEWQSRLNRDKLDVNFRDPDVDEDGEDEDEGPEEVPRKAQKRLRATTLNEDDDDFNESDTAFNADLQALRSRQAKKLKSSTRNTSGPSVSIPFDYFEASSPVLLCSKLPKARPPASSSHFSSTRRSLASSPQAPATPTPSTPPHSRCSVSHSKPRMLDQTPTTRAVVRTANCIFRVYVSTENGFPTEDEIAAHARASFKRACKDLTQTEALTRFETDMAYAAVQAKIVSARPSQLRGELKSKVHNAVVGHYGLHGLSRSRVEMKIATLLCDHAYVFRNPDDPIRTDMVDMVDP